MQMLPRANRKLRAAFATFVQVFVFVACLGAIVLPATPTLLAQATPRLLVGTWTGTSTCVGNRPACKNETVVYRFIPVEGHPSQVRQLADKIIDGRRIPMGALVFDYDAIAGTLRGEFKRGETHGVWSFTVTENTMKGTLVILPEGSVVRDVMVRRVTDDKLPPAPPISDYDQ